MFSRGAASAATKLFLVVGNLTFSCFYCQVFYAIDFGGTNLRAIRCILDGKGNPPTIKALKHNIRASKLGSGLPKGLLDKKATASMLFDDIAAAVDQLIKQEGDSHVKDIGVGFTFSFGVSLKSLKSAILIGWTKVRVPLRCSSMNDTSGMYSTSHVLVNQ